MSVISWTSRAGGSWSTAANWSGGVPTQNDSVTINQGGIIINISGGFKAAAWVLDVQGGATINIAGSSLYTVQNAVLRGALNISSTTSGGTITGGTWTVGGFGAQIYGNTTLDRYSTLRIASGVVGIGGASNLDGTISGAGTLLLSGAGDVIGPNAKVSAPVEITGLTGIGGNLNFTAPFLLLGGGTVDFGGHTVSLSGFSELVGYLSHGTINARGNMLLGTANGAAVFGNGSTLNVIGTATQTGTVALGVADSSATLAIKASGTYTIAGNYAVTDASQASSFTNKGLLTKSAGSGLAIIGVKFTSSGTIIAAVGELDLAGPTSNLSGTVSGAGTLGFLAGQVTLGTKLALNTAATTVRGGVVYINGAVNGTAGYGGIWNQIGGLVSLTKSASALKLTGAANFDGGVLTGFGGTVTLAGQTEMSGIVIGGPIAVSVTGTVHQTGAITVGASSSPKITIQSGGVWLLESNGASGGDNIGGINGEIDNNGQFALAVGAGDAVIANIFRNNASGTLTANIGTIVLAGAYAALSGTLAGSGMIDIDTTTYLSASNLGVAALHIDQYAYLDLITNQTYGGTLGQTGGTFDEAGKTFTLTAGSVATLDGGLLTNTGAIGAGGFTSFGALTFNNYVIGLNARMTIAGNAEQAGSGQTLANNGSLTIAAQGRLTMSDFCSIGGTGALTVAAGGVLATSGTGTSAIGPTLTVLGTLAVNNQLLQLGGAATLGGSVSGAGTLELSNAAGAQTFTLASGLSFTAGGWQTDANVVVNLAGSVSYGGFFNQYGGAFYLGNQTLTLSGTSSIIGAYLGPTTGNGGVLSVTGTADLGATYLLQNARMSVGGTATLGNALQVGEQPGGTVTASSSALSILSGGVVNLDAYASISGLGSVSILSGGTLAAVGDVNVAIATAIVDAGTILANAGTLTCLSAITGSGSIVIGSGGTFTLGTGSSLGSATSLAFGTLAGGDLVLGQGAAFAGIIANFVAGDMIELGALTPGGSLTGTYGTSQKQLIVGDGLGHSVTLNFATNVDLTHISFITAADGLAAIRHT